MWHARCRQHSRYFCTGSRHDRTDFLSSVTPICAAVQQWGWYYSRLCTRHGKDTTQVGVFVDDMPQNIVTRVYNYKLDYIQLHGNEPRETLENLRATIDPDIKPKIKIIKAISVSSAEDIKKYKEYVGAADLFLFDTKCKTVGGSGEQFDWQVLQAYDGDVPFLLSGGIGPDDAERIKNFHHSKCIGIDLNSKFEIEPALKDVEKLKQFLVKVKK